MFLVYLWEGGNTTSSMASFISLNLDVCSFLDLRWVPHLPLQSVEKQEFLEHDCIWTQIPEVRLISRLSFSLLPSSSQTFHQFSWRTQPIPFLLEKFWTKKFWINSCPVLNGERQSLPLFNVRNRFCYQLGIGYILTSQKLHVFSIMHSVCKWSCPRDG